MNRQTYELVAMVCRYWYCLLAAFIVLKGFRIVLADNRADHAARKEARLRGCVGELVVTHCDSRRGLQGNRYPVPAEALVGAGASADIRLRGGGIRKKHLFMTYRKGEMILHPIKDAPIDAARNEDGGYVLKNHGKLTLGDIQMTMIFFDPAKADKADPFDGVWEK